MAESKSFCCGFKRDDERHSKWLKLFDMAGFGAIVCDQFEKFFISFDSSRHKFGFAQKLIPAKKSSNLNFCYQNISEGKGVKGFQWGNFHIMMFQRYKLFA